MVFDSPVIFDRGFFAPILARVELVTMTENRMQKIIALLLAMTLSACAGVTVEDYKNRGPVFSAESFFSGSLTAHGVVKNYRGYASRSFVADITACWQDGVGTLDERFVFDDGENRLGSGV